MQPSRATVAALFFTALCVPHTRVGAQSSAKPARFTLASPDLAKNGRISDAHVFNSFGCSGQNISPTLRWEGAPAGTKSFAITAYDPDAPTGSGWWHWVVYDIPASVSSLAAGAGNASGSALPAGAAQGTTDFGAKAYGGPCPPAGDKPHRYIFAVYALKIPHIDVPANATAAMIGFNIHGNALGSSSFTARYGR